jgi:hypothetical protein
MQPETLPVDPEVRPAKSLVARGGLFRTFGSLLGFLALFLLILGIYILQDTFANPLTAQPTALLAAGFILGLDSVLIYFIMKPHKALRLVDTRRRRRSRLSTRVARRHRFPAPGD